MKKVLAFLSFIFAFVACLFVTSCSGSKSGVEVDMESTSTSSKITLKLTFAENDNLTDGTAVPHIKKYAYDTDTKEVGDYLNTDTKVTFSNGVYTSSSVTFSSLDKDTTYAFKFYVTYNKDEELIATWIIATSNSGDSEETATKITTTDEFLAMSDDPSGYYTLENDLDFAGATISAIFLSTSSTQFSGTFDGNGHTISNFVLSSSNTGLFGYTTEATIKNLVIDGCTDTNDSIVTADYSSGRSTANIGILAGTAANTAFENITVKNVKIAIQGNSSANINVGAVVGSATECSFKAVRALNADITFTQMRLKVCAGLFAGSVSGDAENGTAIEGAYAEGKITAKAYYPSTAGYAYIGGFIGDLGTTSLVKDTYAVADIVVTKSTTSTDSNKYTLAVGGYVGTNLSGSMYVKNAAANADIKVYAGDATEDATELEALNENIMTKNNAYIGGFAGTVKKYINTIADAVYVKKADGIQVYAKTTDDEGTTTVFVSDTVAMNNDDAAKVAGVTVAADYEAVKTAAEAYFA